ncbi:hypothetical protein CAEBREN_31652, partial [Caenorhabditis brenneri]
MVPIVRRPLVAPDGEDQEVPAETGSMLVVPSFKRFPISFLMIDNSEAFEQGFEHLKRLIFQDRNPRRSTYSSKDHYGEWNPGIPSNKLAIMNMPNDVDNTKVITLSLGKCGYLPQDVRTMTKFDKITKQVRTFAFVEFSNVETAEQWMADYEGWLTLDDGRTLGVEYAKGDPAAGSGNKGDDWICAHCSMNNFMKRQSCFKCEISKEQSMELEKLGAHMVG